MTSSSCNFEGFPNGQPIHFRNGPVCYIDEKFNSGGQGDLYIAHDQYGNRFALKHCVGHFSNDKVKSFLLTQLLTRTQHSDDRFCWPLDISNPDSRYNYLYKMHYLEEFEPASVIMKNPDFFSFDFRLAVCREIVEAIGQLHNNGYVFRDISGANIMVKKKSPKAVIRFVDCENILPTGYSIGGVSGTGKYMAPELIRASARHLSSITPNIQTDIHSVGVVTFRILCGKHPLETKAAFEEVDKDRAINIHFGESPKFIFSQSGLVDMDSVVYKRWATLSRPLRAYYSDLFSEKNLKSAPNRLGMKVFLNALKKSV